MSTYPQPQRSTICGGDPLAVITFPESVTRLARRRANLLDRTQESMAFLDVDPNLCPRLWEDGSGHYLKQLIGSSMAELQSAFYFSRNVLHIKGLTPEHKRPSTPYGGHSLFSDIPTTLMNVFGTVRLMAARSFAYATENDGLVVRDVVARKDAGNEHSSQGWAYELTWHMDGAFRPLTEGGSLSPCPRWLVFGVIFNTPNIPITFAALDEVLNRLGPSDIEMLSRPEFEVHSPESFLAQVVRTSVPILIPDGAGGYFSRFNKTKCFGRTPAARAALDSFADVLLEPGIRRNVELTPGDVIVLDNWRSLHMREAYTPSWNGTDRWLVRVYASPAFQAGFPQYIDKPHIWR
jgi:L-asparagine oxygenase